MSDKNLFIIVYTLTLISLLVFATKNHEIIFKINKIC